jgi:hypothetical protein
MGMEYIRNAYGVPAKRGGLVKPKTGPAIGQVGRILREKNSRLTVRDNGQGRAKAWIGDFHPRDLEYLDNRSTQPEPQA